MLSKNWRKENQNWHEDGQHVQVQILTKRIPNKVSTFTKTYLTYRFFQQKKIRKAILIFGGHSYDENALPYQSLKNVLKTQIFSTTKIRKAILTYGGHLYDEKVLLHQSLKSLYLPSAVPNTLLFLWYLQNTLTYNYYNLLTFIQK